MRSKAVCGGRGGQVRINVQLIDAETGGHLWADRFDTERRDLAAAEDEIVGRLAHTLNLELVADVGRRIRLEGASDPDARDLIMRGWAQFYRPRSAANLQEARRAFERALALRPQSRRARIGLATVLATTVLEGWSRSLGRIRHGPKNCSSKSLTAAPTILWRITRWRCCAALRAS